MLLTNSIQCRTGTCSYACTNGFHKCADNKCYPDEDKSHCGADCVACDSGSACISGLCMGIIPDDGVITTVAGNGAYGFSGDGGQATSAQLMAPYNVAVDASGNLYIADSHTSRIRKVGVDGVITTVAGNGVAGFSGDGGQATSAQLWIGIAGMAVDASGNLYIADDGNSRIRKVGVDGVITTAAGNGVYGFSGDGGQATSAQLKSPYGVAVDASGNLYIADHFNDRIRKVGADGVITTVAGNGDVGNGFNGDGGQATSAQLRGPWGVAVDASGNLYITETLFHRIRKVRADGVITTVAGNGASGFSGDGGQATSAQLSEPLGVAVDASGNLYFADTNNHRIRKVRADGVITTVAGNGAYGFSGDGGQATSAQLSVTHGVAVDASGNLYIADTDNQRIRKIGKWL